MNDSVLILLSIACGVLTTILQREGFDIFIAIGISFVIGIVIMISIGNIYGW